MGGGDYLAIEDVMTYQLHHGNCIDIMPLIERESVDAIVTDPPYGLDFMGKDWDHGIPGEHFWREAYRCVKPGAYLLAFGGTRTFHRLAVTIEDAGWEIRDTVMWVYGQGFPKSHDVSKAIDREAGAEREVIGQRPNPIRGRSSLRRDYQVKQGYRPDGDKYPGEDKPLDITNPATPAAAEWDGWGTALKPAWEPIIVARKPLQGTVAENVQRYGTGAMNIDACRIGTDERTYSMSGAPGGNGQRLHGGDGRDAENAIRYAEESKSKPDVTVSGRWPANVIHDGSAEVLAGFPMTGVSTGGRRRVLGVGMGDMMSGRNMTEPGDPGYGDTGSAARFFYCAKASKADRDEGLEDYEAKRIGHNLSTNACARCGKRVKHNGSGDGCECGELRETIKLETASRNGHPTVKPTALMRYLCRLVTPPNGTILDPFMGSGSTGKAAMLEGFNFIGIDTEIEYVEIAARRIEHACEKVGIVIEQPMMFETQREKVDRPKQLILL